MNQTVKQMEKKTTTIKIAGLDALLYAVTIGVSFFIVKEVLKEVKKFREGK